MAEQIESIDTSDKPSLPDNNKAHLMYYLNCGCVVLDLTEDEDIARLTDYNNCDLTGEETDKLVSLCYHLSPEVLEGKVSVPQQNAI